MGFELLEEGIKRAMLQIASNIRKALDGLDWFGCDNLDFPQLVFSVEPRMFLRFNRGEERAGMWN